MMQQFACGAAAALLVSAAGCSWFLPSRYDYEPLDANKPYWLNYDASRRGGFVLPGDSKARLVAEPAPDAAVSTALEFLAKAEIKEAEGSGETQLKYAENVVELTKRHETVLLLREALYRISEMSSNGFLGDGANASKNVEVLFKEALSAVVSLAEAQRVQEVRKLVESAAVQARLEDVQRQILKLKALLKDIESGLPVAVANEAFLELGVDVPSDSIKLRSAVEARIESLEKERSTLRGDFK